MGEGLEVRQADGMELVTVIELLSPSNKSVPGCFEYQARRRDLILQHINLVEIDLLTAGRRIAMGGPLPPGDYYAFVSRPEAYPDCSVYAWSVRRPLPTLPIPLRLPDADVPLDLAAVVNEAYDRGRYARSLGYQVPLTLPLPPDDRDWAEGLAKGLRS